MTLEGCYLYTDFMDDSIERAKGRVVHAEIDPIDGCVWCTMFVDASAYPQLARGIREGYITDVAATWTVDRSECSVCGNEARTERDWCDHIRNHKGQILDGSLVCEIGRGIRFVNLSFLV